MQTHGSIFRIILLLPLAGTTLPSAETQAPSLPLNGGVGTGELVTFLGDKQPSCSRTPSVTPLPRKMATT